MNTLPKAMPTSIVLEKPGRNLDSLVKNAAMTQLEETLVFEWQIRHAFEDVDKYGIRQTSLAIFHGPPGNGKTMAAKMLSKVIGAPLYRVTCEGIIHAYLGKTEQNMRELMDWLSGAGPAVVLFDECEALFRRRGSANDSCTQSVVRAMQVFWQMFDSWDAPQIFLLATNRIQDIDDALLSRCETQLEFNGPTIEQAALVIDYWAEVLHEQGAEQWAPLIRKAIQKKAPVSFRALWQMISTAVRAWIVAANRDQA